MDLIFCKLKKLKKHEFHFLQAYKTSKIMNFIFCKLKDLKKHAFHFFASLKNLKKHECYLFFILFYLFIFFFLFHSIVVFVHNVLRHTHKQEMEQDLGLKCSA